MSPLETMPREQSYKIEETFLSLDLLKPSTVNVSKKLTAHQNFIAHNHEL